MDILGLSSVYARAEDLIIIGMATTEHRSPVPPIPRNPPIWRQWRGLLIVEAVRFFTGTARLLASPGARWLLMLLGLVVQGVLLWLMWELVDLCISLMEVWAELARKHLELMLS